MKMVDQAKLIQALQDTFLLVSCNVDAEKHSVARESQRSSISQLIGELSKDWCDILPHNTAQPSVGIPD